MLEIQLKKQLSTFQLTINQMIPCQGITAILGVSGSGKSTLINLINGLIKPDSGLIKLNNQTLVDIENKQFIPAERRNIGTIFQDPLLFPHFNVHKNLTYGMKTSAKQQFNEVVNVLNIQHLLNRYPAMLSGGEKQRVAIGRALLSQPQLLLMDEPLSALDMPRKKELIGYINQLVKNINIPIIYVTHNINEVKKLANYVVIIDQGSVYDAGKSEIILQSDYLQDWM